MVFIPREVRSCIAISAYPAMCTVLVTETGPGEEVELHQPHEDGPGESSEIVFT